MAFGIRVCAIVDVAATRTRPCRPLARSVMAEPSASSSASTRSAKTMAWSAASVLRRERVVRSNMRRPMRCSNSRSSTLTAGCVSASWSAALDNWPL